LGVLSWAGSYSEKYLYLKPQVNPEKNIIKEREKKKLNNT
jgi:hypothetical protein